MEKRLSAFSYQVSGKTKPLRLAVTLKEDFADS